MSNPGRAFYIAALLRRVINYLKELCVTVRLRAASPDFARFARPFGTGDIRLIIGRIAGAISHAAIVEGNLLKIARLGRHLLTKPDAPSDTAQSPHAPRPSPAPAKPVARHARQPRHPPLDRLPSQTQIAAAVRRQPIRVVVAGICRDLGITPNHRLWQALSEVVTPHGGTLTELRQEIEDRCPVEHWPPPPIPDTRDTGAPAITLDASEGFGADIFAAAVELRQRPGATRPP